MKDEDKTKEQLIHELNRLRAQISELGHNQLTHNDKLKLAVIDRSPFSMWACDQNFKIVLWTKGCEHIYGRRESEALSKNYLNLFIDEPERQQSQEDCLKVINQDHVFKNFLAYDISRDGSRRTMLTNCFRIWDEVTQQHLQAEIALEISDLELRKDEHRSLRELGIALLEQQKKVFRFLQHELLLRISRTCSLRLTAMDKKQQELDRWRNKIRRTSGDEILVDNLTKEQQQQIDKGKENILQMHESLHAIIFKAEKMEELDEIEPDIQKFERDLD